MMENKQEYNFNQVIDRWDYYESWYDSKILKTKYGFNDKNILDFGIADINFKTPEPILKAFRDRVDKGTFSYSYICDDTINAIKQWYKEWHNIDTDQYFVKVVHGTVNAIYQIVQEFSADSKNMLLMTPLYQPFANAVLTNNCHIIEHKLKLNDKLMRYEIDFVQLEQQIIKNNIKLLLFCHPHNPSSQIWNKVELLKLKDICQKHNVVIFSDEVHSDMVFTKFTSFLEIDYDQVIVGNSVNKAFNLAGLNSSYLIIKDEHLNKRINQRFEMNGLGCGPNVFVNYVYQAAFLNPEIKVWLKQMKQYVHNNFVYLKQEVSKLNLEIFELDSTYLAWIKLPTSSLTVYNKLLKHNVKVYYADHFYGCPDEYLRINIATNREQIEEFVKILADCL